MLVLLTLRPKGASITRRLASSVAQLLVSAVEVGATTLTATIPGELIHERVHCYVSPHCC